MLLLKPKISNHSIKFIYPLCYYIAPWRYHFHLRAKDILALFVYRWQINVLVLSSMLTLVQLIKLMDHVEWINLQPRFDWVWGFRIPISIPNPTAYIPRSVNCTHSRSSSGVDSFSSHPRYIFDASWARENKTGIEKNCVSQKGTEKKIVSIDLLHII